MALRLLRRFGRLTPCDVTYSACSWKIRIRSSRYDVWGLFNTCRNKSDDDDDDDNFVALSKLQTLMPNGKQPEHLSITILSNCSYNDGSSLGSRSISILHIWGKKPSISSSGNCWNSVNNVHLLLGDGIDGIDDVGNDDDDE